MPNKLEICCTNPNCKTWFQSPYFYGQLDTFNASALKGLKAQCPSCGKIVSGTNKNTRIVEMNDFPINKSS